MNFAVEADDYRCIIYGVSKSDAINLLENLLYGCGFIKNHGKKKNKKNKKIKKIKLKIFQSMRKTTRIWLTFY